MVRGYISFYPVEIPEKLHIDNRSKSRFRQKVLEFIRAYIRIHGVSPSYTVMMKGLDARGRGNLHRIVKRLEDEGLLERKPGRRHNGIRVIDKSVKRVAAL